VLERIRGSGDFKTNHSEHIVTFFPQMFVLCRTGKGVFSAMKLGKTRSSKDDHKKEGKYR